MKYASAQDRDANYQPIGGILPFRAYKRITFDGGTANAIGNDGGTNDPYTIFTVTGDVLVSLYGVVKTTLVGAASLWVGVSGADDAVFQTVNDATTLVVNEVWGADASVSLAEAITPRVHGIGGGLDITGNVGTTNITAGVIDFYCFFRPLSDDGSVEAA